MHLITQEHHAIGIRPQEVKKFAKIARKWQSSDSDRMAHALNHQANLSLSLRIITVTI